MRLVKDGEVLASYYSLAIHYQNKLLGDEMTIKVIGLIELKDLEAFEEYRSQVGNTVALYQGKIVSRGTLNTLLWNELECGSFSAFVELEFPNLERSQAWANSPEYQSLLSIRSKAMKLTLFSVTV
jgi:uncharacterized protein (DUF1330 family)